MFVLTAIAQVYLQSNNVLAYLSLASSAATMAWSLGADLFKTARLWVVQNGEVAVIQRAETYRRRFSRLSSTAVATRTGSALSLLPRNEGGGGASAAALVAVSAAAPGGVESESIAAGRVVLPPPLHAGSTRHNNALFEAAPRSDQERGETPPTGSRAWALVRGGGPSLRTAPKRGSSQLADTGATSDSLHLPERVATLPVVSPAAAAAAEATTATTATSPEQQQPQQEHQQQRKKGPKPHKSLTGKSVQWISADSYSEQTVSAAPSALTAVLEAPQPVAAMQQLQRGDAEETGGAPRSSSLATSASFGKKAGGGATKPPKRTASRTDSKRATPPAAEDASAPADADAAGAGELRFFFGAPAEDPCVCAGVPLAPCSLEESPACAAAAAAACGEELSCVPGLRTFPDALSYMYGEMSFAEALWACVAPPVIFIAVFCLPAVNFLTIPAWYRISGRTARAEAVRARAAAAAAEAAEEQTTAADGSSPGAATAAGDDEAAQAAAGATVATGSNRGKQKTKKQGKAAAGAAAADRAAAKVAPAPVPAFAQVVPEEAVLEGEHEERDAVTVFVAPAAADDGGNAQPPAAGGSSNISSSSSAGADGAPRPQATPAVGTPPQSGRAEGLRVPVLLSADSAPGYSSGQSEGERGAADRVWGRAAAASRAAGAAAGSSTSSEERAAERHQQQALHASTAVFAAAAEASAAAGPEAEPTRRQRLMEIAAAAEMTSLAAVAPAPEGPLMSAVDGGRPTSAAASAGRRAEGSSVPQAAGGGTMREQLAVFVAAAVLPGSLAPLSPRPEQGPSSAGMARRRVLSAHGGRTGGAISGLPPPPPPRLGGASPARLRGDNDATVWGDSRLPASPGGAPPHPRLRRPVSASPSIGSSPEPPERSRSSRLLSALGSPRRSSAEQQRPVFTALERLGEDAPQDPAAAEQQTPAAAAGSPRLGRSPRGSVAAAGGLAPAALFQQGRSRLYLSLRRPESARPAAAGPIAAAQLPPPDTTSVAAPSGQQPPPRLRAWSAGPERSAVEAFPPGGSVFPQGVGDVEAGDVNAQHNT